MLAANAQLDAVTGLAAALGGAQRERRGAAVDDILASTESIPIVGGPGAITATAQPIDADGGEPEVDCGPVPGWPLDLFAGENVRVAPAVQRLRWDPGAGLTIT